MNRTSATMALRLAASLLAVACGSTEAPAEEEGATVPAALDAVESGAEDAFDLVLAEDYGAARPIATKIQEDWDGFRATAADDGADTATLEAMDAAVVGFVDAVSAPGDRIVVARSANAISATMDELFALYEPVIPPTVLELDYLGREVLLDGESLDFARSTTDIASIEGVWTDLRAEVVDLGGEQEAADFDASIQRARDASTGEDGPALAEEARVQLELVDALEQVFGTAAEEESEGEEEEEE